MALEPLKKLASEEGLPLHTIAAELIQIAFLDALYAQKESTEIVFHGGTCIRLLHGGYRYSEDLDFAVPKLGHGQLRSVLKKIIDRTKHLLTTVIGNLDIELAERPDRGKNIFIWWLKAVPLDYRGKIHVKLEFGHYPVYQKRPLAVTLRHPLISLQPITISESIDELLLDKINALAGRQYLKNRDFFDIWYLTTVLKPAVDYNMLKTKFEDYRTKNPVQALKRRLTELNPRLITETMEKFLPEKYRRLFATTNYKEIIDANRRIIDEVINNIS